MTSERAINSIGNILEHVETAGKIGTEAQQEIRFSDRSYKGDGSVVTETDKQIDEYLFEQIAALYPQANVLTEETVRAFDPQKPYTLAVDPIDGTDVFSQGMAGWCVSVGLFDGALTPIAGIVYAPKLDLLLFADVGKRATLNGSELSPPDLLEPLSDRSNVMVMSQLHRRIDLSKLPGKIRNIGSAALHLCFPLLYSGVVGAIEGPGGHIWDIAGAHAVLRSHGFDLELLGGGGIDYVKMVDGSPVGAVILAGREQRIDELRGVLGRSRPMAPHRGVRG
jgi:fructose-1,6-bisphosphatase/inositol monophosphatase family enzyme